MIPNRLFEKLKSFNCHTELRAQRNIERRVTLLNGALTANSQTTTGGVSARVYKNGVWGFAANPEFTDESVQSVIRAATDNAVFLDSREKKDKPALKLLPDGDHPLSHAFPTTDQKRIIDFLGEIDAYIQKNCSGIISRVVTCPCLDMEKMVYASDGAKGHFYVPRAHIYVFLTTEKDGEPVELFEPTGGYGVFDDVFTKPEALFPVVDKLYEQVMHKKEGVFANAGYKDVILHSDLAGMLAHEAVGHTTEADLVLGGSVAGHNLGKPVASELITMIDYANEALGQPCPIPVTVDDEGTTARDAVLIEKGILRGFMHNRESAQHFGAEPTGNARAYLYSDEPLIRMRNTAVLPGSSKLEDMIAAIDDGYFFVKTGNGQADTTGEFTFSIEFGYEIKKGKIANPIKETSISGVAFDMLKTVDMVSDEMSWTCSGMCGKKQPIPVGMGGPAIKCKVNVGGR